MTSRIAYQGEPGANSDIVARQHYPELETVSCASFEDAFAAVAGGEVELAMIPIDNSVAGRVADIHHFLPTAGLHIIAEHFFANPVQSVGLAGFRLGRNSNGSQPRARLGADSEDHQEARLDSGRRWRHGGAAREVAESGNTTRAAISPPLAAELYGLDVLASNIEDEDDNTTRFVVLSREPRWPSSGSGPCITTFLLSVTNLPGALYKSLGGFATNGVNMSKLESYMVGDSSLPLNSWLKWIGTRMIIH